MSEWFKEHAWKACVGETLPWVRIPLSPPTFAKRPLRSRIRLASRVTCERHRRLSRRSGVAAKADPLSDSFRLRARIPLFQPIRHLDSIIYNRLRGFGATPVTASALRAPYIATVRVAD